jgi:phosphoenolpyruvate-protein phosphotransferase
MQIEGTAASSGIAIGKAFVLPDWEWEITERPIDVSDLAKEFERLYDGIRSSKMEIRNIKEELREVIGDEESTIFDAHLAILDDPVFMNEVQGIIRRQYKAAEVAVKEAIEKFAGMFDLLDDEYMKERAMDIKDVGNRLIKHLVGAPEVTLPKDAHPFILVARELAPSQLAHLNPKHVLGIVTMAGGKTSHSVIMAKALGIPCVIGLEGKLEQPIATGDVLIVDGHHGVLHVHPDVHTLKRYYRLRREWQQQRRELERMAPIVPVTADGVRIRLEANLNTAREAEQANRYGADGVGLFRTEFLYMDRDSLPDENEQFEVYKQVALAMGEKPLTIRTLDIGGDKKLEYLPLPEEDNPFLGYRAIRISLDRTDLFKTQLRAILRASHYGNLRLMYPMISSVDEVRKANAILREAMAELRRERVAFNENIKVGITIEVPAACMMADWLAKEVDFFSIGTNDLVQYVLAVDRMNEKLADSYEPYHPAVIRMLKQAADGAKSAGIEIAVCGELAGDVRALPLWIGLGIHNLSMSFQSILAMKKQVLETNAGECRKLFGELLKCGTSAEVHRLLEQVPCSACS